MQLVGALEVALVEAARFELATPMTGARRASCCRSFNILTPVPQCGRGLFRGLSVARDRLHRGGDLVFEHVRVPCRRLKIGVVQHLLHKLEVAGLAQHLGAEIMPEVVESKTQ